MKSRKEHACKKNSKLDNIKENFFLHNVAFLFSGDKGRRVNMIEH
jgi:hypothetical protein